MVYFWTFQNTPNHVGCLQDKQYRLYNALGSSLPSIFPLPSNFRAIRRRRRIQPFWHLSAVLWKGADAY